MKIFKNLPSVFTSNCLFEQFNPEEPFIIEHYHHGNYTKKRHKMQHAVNSQEKMDIINVVHSNENFPRKKWLKQCISVSY